MVQDSGFVPLIVSALVIFAIYHYNAKVLRPIIRSSLFLVLSVALAACSRTSETNIVSYADPFVGTGFHGHTYPGATTPFGMVQLSPDTRNRTWDGCSGYHYSDASILGFFLGFMRYKYRSIKLTIFIHILFNIMGTYGDTLMEKIIPNDGIKLILGGVALFVLVFATALVNSDKKAYKAAD